MIALIKYWSILNKEAENKILEKCANTCGQIKSGGLENPYGQFTCPPLKARKYVASSVPPTTLYLHRLMTPSACPPGLAGIRL
jgi:hypothetical protein